jgi:hypothetical protein
MGAILAKGFSEKKVFVCVDEAEIGPVQFIEEAGASGPEGTGSKTKFGGRFSIKVHPA